jgi:hypothetical protein
LPGLSKQSLGLLDTDDDDVDRDDGELHAVNDAVCALDEVDVSLRPECARGRRGFLRKPSSLSESELDEDATPSAPYDLRFFSLSVKSRGGEKQSLGDRARAVTRAWEFLAALAPFLPLRLRRF